jgi:hypothetical protein
MLQLHAQHALLLAVDTRQRRCCCCCCFCCNCLTNAVGLSRVCNQERIAELEAQALSVKEWTMRGEIEASRRPLNSALEVDMDFDTTGERGCWGGQGLSFSQLQEQQSGG